MSSDTLTVIERDQLLNEDPRTMPLDLEETRRTADIRSPLTRDYDFPAVRDEVLGRESATCEACGETVDPNAGGGLAGGEPFVIWELVENIYTLENQVLLCETCVNRPDAEWRADVRAKRARQREQPPSWSDRVAHWVSDPTAISVFARRVAATVAGVVIAIGFVATIAGIVGSFIAGIATGITWARTVITTFWGISVLLATYPWTPGVIIGVAYTAHAIERVHYDPRGYIPRDRPPWVPLSVAGLIAGVGAFGLLAVETARVPAVSLIFPVVAIVWATGAAGVACYIDRAIRHDLAIGIWRPSRGVWMVAARVGLLPGLLAITVGVPFPDVVSPVTTGVLAAIPAGVALGFAGRRLPYDPRARDRILSVLPQRLLDRQRSE